MQQESTFWKRSLWQKAGGGITNEFKLAGDFDLWSRFYSHTDLYGTTSPLGGFRVQVNQRSGQIGQYVGEAEKALTRIRTEFKWTPNFSRDIAFRLRLNQIPKVSKLTESMYSYSGKRVVINKLDSPDSCWEVEDYKFC